MWKLNKPYLQTAIDDIDMIISHCRDIKDMHKTAFGELYKKYDECNGSLDMEYHNAFMESFPVQADTMKKQYAKLSMGQELDFIRKELLSSVNVCPYCGFGEANTLDHVLPESVYKELATCRLNLVPLCWTCNHKKRANDYNGFIHAYYQEYPLEVVFFKCHITISTEDALILEFIIDENVITPSLKDKLQNQIETIELNDRLQKQCITYLQDNFYVGDIRDDASLTFFLTDKINKAKKIFGMNHYKTAFLQGLHDCEKFNVEFLNRFLVRNVINSPI